MKEFFIIMGDCESSCRHRFGLSSDSGSDSKRTKIHSSKKSTKKRKSLRKISHFVSPGRSLLK